MSFVFSIVNSVLLTSIIYGHSHTENNISRKLIGGDWKWQSVARVTKAVRFFFSVLMSTSVERQVSTLGSIFSEAVLLFKQKMFTILSVAN